MKKNLTQFTKIEDKWKEGGLIYGVVKKIDLRGQTPYIMEAKGRSCFMSAGNKDSF